MTTPTQLTPFERRLVALLRECEWSADSTGEDGEFVAQCPICTFDRSETGEHADDCRLAAALAIADALPIECLIREAGELAHTHDSFTASIAPGIEINDPLTEGVTKIKTLLENITGERFKR